MLNTEGSSDVAQLVKSAKRNFLKLARVLKKIHDEAVAKDPANGKATFEKMLEPTSIKLRKAYYLIEIEEVFGDLNLPSVRLSNIGWTKLAVIAPFVGLGNLEELLTLAEQLKTRELKSALKNDGQEPISQFVSLAFTKAQYDTFRDALLKFGASLTPKDGWFGKEKAITAICVAALKQE